MLRLFVGLALACLCCCISALPNDAEIGNGRQAVTSQEIDVLKAKTEMLTYLTSENCTIDDELRTNLGLVLGQQYLLKVKSASSKYGLVTIHSDYEDGTDDDDIRMALIGRQRFDQTDGFDAYASAWTPQHGQTESWLDSNNEMGEFKEETSSSQTDILILAPHGGAIESYTDDLAGELYSGLTIANGKDASLWYCIGHQDAIGAFDAWHITSTDLSEVSFPYLGDVGSRTYSYAVSIHGYSGTDVLVGGGASTSFKDDVKDALDAISWSYTVTVVGEGDSYGGTDPENIVNRYSSAGVQLEIPYNARRDHWEDVADALADFYAALI